MFPLRIEGRVEADENAAELEVQSALEDFAA